MEMVAIGKSWTFVIFKKLKTSLKSHRIRIIAMLGLNPRLPKIISHQKGNKFVTESNELNKEGVKIDSFYSFNSITKSTKLQFDKEVV